MMVSCATLIVDICESVHLQQPTSLRDLFYTVPYEIRTKLSYRLDVTHDMRVALSETETSRKTGGS